MFRLPEAVPHFTFPRSMSNLPSSFRRIHISATASLPVICYSPFLMPRISTSREYPHRYPCHSSACQRQTQLIGIEFSSLSAESPKYLLCWNRFPNRFHFVWNFLGCSIFVLASSMRVLTTYIYSLFQNATYGK